MPFTTYAELQTAANTWLRRTVTAADLQDLIRLAETKIRRNIRCREMESTPTVTVNARRVSLPTGYIAMRGSFYLSGDPVAQLSYMAPENFWAKWASSTTEKPKAYTIEGGEFVFGPAPDSSYTGNPVIYSLASLASSVPTLYTNHPDLYLYGVLLESEGYYGPNAWHDVWAARYQAAAEEIIKSSAKDRIGGGALVARPQVVGP